MITKNVLAMIAIVIGVIAFSAMNKKSMAENREYIEYSATELESGETLLISGPAGYIKGDSVWIVNDVIDWKGTNPDAMRAIINCSCP